MTQVGLGEVIGAMAFVTTVICTLLAFYVRATIQSSAADISTPILAEMDKFHTANADEHKEIRAAVSELAKTATKNQVAIARIEGATGSAEIFTDRREVQLDTGHRRRWND